jgi:hypothetical protein
VIRPMRDYGLLAMTCFVCCAGCQAQSQFPGTFFHTCVEPAASQTYSDGNTHDVKCDFEQGITLVTIPPGKLSPAELTKIGIPDDPAASILPYTSTPSRFCTIQQVLPAPPAPATHISSAVLNHVQGGASITRVYDRYSYDAEKRRALETWSRTLQSILDQQESGKLLPFDSAVG